MRGLVAVIALVASLFVMQAPAPAASVVPVRSVAVGYDQSCVIDSSAQAWCWGRNNNGQLGTGNWDDSTLPVLVSGSITWASIDTGDSLSCGVSNTGVGYCWGRNNVGQLGAGAGGTRNTPGVVGGGHVWRTITAGDSFACGIDTSNAAWCWGLGGDGQLGDGNQVNSNLPSLVSGGLLWSSIKASEDAGRHTCGVTTAGDAYCWGLNANGQLGRNSTTFSATPVAVNGGLKWTQLTTGGASTCGVADTGAGYCWGSGYIGQNGDGFTADRLVPTLVSGGYSWKEIQPGGGATCGVRSTGAAYCWGANGLGALGDGTNNQSNTPVAVAGGYNFTTVTIGAGHSCGITTASVIYCWGWNAYGQVGDGTTTNRNAPLGVLTLTNLSASSTLTVVVDPSFSFAVAGYNSGTCNGATINATSSSATAVPLRPTTGTNAIGGQTLTVSANSGGGYTIFVRSTGVLSDGSGHTIPDWTGTNAAPTSFPAAGNARLGYTTDHALSGSATRFQTDLWAGFTGSNQEVANATSVASADVTHLCMQAGIAADTAAGTYSTTVIYIAVPTF